MAIYKKERAWSEKLTSAEVDIPLVQRGVIAAMRRGTIVDTYLPTTIKKPIKVTLTPLNQKAGSRFSIWYYNQNDNLASLNAASAFFADSASGAARVAEQLVYSSGSIYEFLVDVASGVSGTKLASAVAQGKAKILKNYSTVTTKAFIKLTSSVAAASTASRRTTFKVAYEIMGYDS